MAAPPPVDLPAPVCRDYPRSSRLEWLLTSGTGGFAMGTVAGANTRRYHGLLVASLRPPVQRVVTLARVEETALLAGGELPLAVNQYPGTLYPEGHRRLTSFRWEGGPVWTWDVGGAALERRVLLVPGAQTVVLRYACTAPLRLRLEPLLAFRDYHALAHRNDAASTAVEERADGGQRRVGFRPYPSLPALWMTHRGTAFVSAPAWHENVEYLEELGRGLDFREDLLLPGHWELELHPGAPQLVGATVDGPEAVDLARCARLFERPAERSSMRVRLERAAEAYPARRADGSATVLAGYPWFTDWGRDTMISLPGLLLARGRLDEARQVLEGFLAHLDGGLVPNRFPDAAGPAEYNTVDATLWMFQAVRAWLAAGGSGDFLRRFYSAGCEIVEAHRRGTHHGIRVDPADGLLVAGDAGSNLTWMDARVNGVPVTPRHGKPVEVNALWYNALRLLEEWAHVVGDRSAAPQFGHEASRVQAAFDRAFWNEARRCCFDVLLPEGPDPRLRPNQLLALGLPFPLLDARRRALALSTVEAALLTPVGLRTLSPDDPGYRPTYRGGPAERDAAYHQGLVWPWLLGPYADAVLSVRGDAPGTRAQLSKALAPLLDRLDAGCLEQLPECYEPEPPFRAVGAPAQAWSVAEALRILVRLDAPAPITPPSLRPSN
jgi:predicted glycogen debranching enzyme